ncbi:MAG: hypothetical protein KAG45_04975, partial [Methyloprofundus sp.]|nr:hypothetical protein [Methyloprofundus sp.]
GRGDFYASLFLEIVFANFMRKCSAVNTYENLDEFRQFCYFQRNENTKKGTLKKKCRFLINFIQLTDNCKLSL